MRWDLLDEFKILKKGARAEAVKTFTGREDFFAEHEPGNPRVPEPLFIEMVAQTGGVLFGLGLEFKKEVILAKIEDAQFFCPVVPPCALRIEAWFEDEREDGAWMAGRVFQDGREVAAAKIMLAAVDSLVENPDQKVVFNQGFISHYDIWNIAAKSEGMSV